MTTEFNNFSLSGSIPADDSRQEEWATQRASRGFDNTELWNLDSTIAKFILPRLVAFRTRAEVVGYPGQYSSAEEWQAIMDEMIFAFGFIAGDAKFDTHSDEIDARISKGLALFAENLMCMWD